MNDGKHLVFIDATKHEIMGRAEVGDKPANVSFSPDNKYAWAGVYGPKEFVAVELATMKVAGRIPAGKGANAVYFVPGRDDLAIGTSEADDFVTFIDTKNFKKLRDVYTPLGAHNIAYTPDGKVAIISCNKSREAVLIDVEKMEEIKVIPNAGAGNNGVRWVPYGKGLGPSNPYSS